MNASIAAARAGRAVGAMFFTFFGTAWMVWWCLEKFGVDPVALVAIAAGGIALFVLAIRQFRQNRSAYAAEAESPEAKRANRIFNRVNTAQWVAVTVSALVLANTGNGDWVRVAIIFVVGVHFLPLAWLFAYRWHYVTGAALILLAVVYPFITPTGPLNPVGLLGAGVILWTSALLAVTPREAPSMGPSTGMGS